MTKVPQIDWSKMPKIAPLSPSKIKKVYLSHERTANTRTRNTKTRHNQG